MKKIIPRTLVLFSASLCAAACVFAAAHAGRSETVPAAEAFSSNHYTLSVYDGRVAVYDAAVPGIPERVTDIPVSGLRSSDAEALVRGIPAETFEDILRILEDLNS